MDGRFLILLASAGTVAGTVASGDTRKLSVGSRRRTKGANVQLQRVDGTHESWLTAVQMNTCARRRSQQLLLWVKGGMLHDEQGHKIEAHGTRTVLMRLGGQSVGAEFRVTNVRTTIISMGKLVKQGHIFEAGATCCKMSTSDRSVTLDVVIKSLPGWTPKAHTTIEGARNADARLVAPVVDGLPEELPPSPGLATKL